MTHLFAKNNSHIDCTFRFTNGNKENSQNFSIPFTLENLKFI